MKVILYLYRIVIVRRHPHIPDIDTRRQSRRTEILRFQKEGFPRDACDTRYYRERKGKSECVLAVHVESEKAFLANEAKTGVQPEGSSIVYFSLKDDL